MTLDQVDSWPPPLLKYLASQRKVLLAHGRHDRRTMKAYLSKKKSHVPWALMPSNPYFEARQEASQSVLELLQSTVLRGWHCTRLTEGEVRHIESHGMQLPNPQMLHDRIRRVQADGFLTPQVAQRLIDENQANDSNRKGMIWFCFFEPRHAGKYGIERFFRRWGGEALYNSHEDDPTTGNALLTIGRPCVIEADVAISHFGRVTRLGDNVVRRYLLSEGFDTGESWHHDDNARGPIIKESIVRFYFHGEEEFARLTGCNSWKPSLV